MPSRLQVLLRIVYETLHRAYRTVGRVSGREDWKPIANPHKYDGERIVIGSVTDGYNPYEEQFRRTRRLLEELRGSNAEIMVCTKSDLVLRDLDLLKRFPK